MTGTCCPVTVFAASFIALRSRSALSLGIATTLAESAVNSLLGKRMVKKQQMRWTLQGAHTVMQVRTVW
ncbi:hypothetical protein [Rhizobium mesoamericanum]|uniref:hypothetical protein n=1 Tax=Rhizobium mesoamericanum TaxID=1079800 RepID=UPI00041C0622|nr:hypothetical protein [Rhizobium mesoamericanum]